MTDPNFARTVVLMIDHTPEGASTGPRKLICWIIFRGGGRRRSTLGCCSSVSRWGKEGGSVWLGGFGVFGGVAGDLVDSGG